MASEESTGVQEPPQPDQPSPFDRARRWFATLSIRARAALGVAAGAVALGVANQVGTDIADTVKAILGSIWFNSDAAPSPESTYEQPAAPRERAPHEIPEAEKRAMFAKIYPGAEYSGPILPYEDGTFKTVAEKISLLEGQWQGGYRIPINGHLTLTRLKFTPGKLMIGEVILPGCSASFLMYRADNLDNITFRKQSDSGRKPCSDMIALQMDVPSGTIGSMSLSMKDGSTTGQGPVAKAFVP